VAFARARSFGSLRGFSRVGGVLIGTVPATGGSIVDAVDFQWRAERNHVSFTVKTKAGQEFQAGPFQQALVPQALAYAADGRPLAVTMVTARPLSELAILVHPTLVDTPLGGRLIDLDRFVDVFTSNLEYRSEAVREVYLQRALYEFARAARLLAKTGPLNILAERSRAEKPALSEFIANEIKRARAIVSENSQTTQQIAAALKSPAMLRDHGGSLWRAKPEFFDQHLVSAIYQVAKQDMTPDTLLNDLTAHFASETAPIRAFGDLSRVINSDGDSAAIRTLLFPVPEFQIWSGVRETDLPTSFEVLARDASQHTLNLRFMLQVAFTTPPNFAQAANNAPQDDDFIDTKPWEFPDISSRIHDEVLASLARPENADFNRLHKDMVEFVHLQRFFRLALANRLGLDFPTRKLIELQNAMLASWTIPKHRTLRWNCVYGRLEQSLRSLGRELDDKQWQALWSEYDVVVGDREKWSKSLADELLAKPDEFPHLSTQWDASWELSERQLEAWEGRLAAYVAKALSSVGENSQSLALLRNTCYIQRIRRLMGLWKDDSQLVFSRHLPRPAVATLKPD
jgi:hypothetical protein